jgi:AcrR family transcriptional regulator
MADGRSDTGRGGRRSYHHGDLPQTLMDAAVRHIAAEGTENLSLRALARECGVSPTAPYRHFPSKRCLLAAVATRGFRELRESLSAALLPEDALEAQLLALAGAYVDFAVSNPTTYGMMFGSVIEDFSEYDMLAEAAEGSYAVVRDVLEKLTAEHPRGDRDVDQLAGTVWAAVHGVASLLLNHLAPDAVDAASGPMRASRSLSAHPEQALALLLRGLFADD